MADDEAEKGYTWETEYERTWEVLQEDAEGSLQASVDDAIHKAKKRRLVEKPVNIRLGMMRHLFIIVDKSQSMEDQDLRPTRLMTSLKLLEHFVEEFYDQNPISQLGLITTSNKRAERVTELGGNPKRHIKCLQSLSKSTCSGEPSLQNSLELALQTLRHVPGHASREILIIFGSLTTCDPENIHETIKSLKEFNIRCSVIGLSADVKVCRTLCDQTQGKYNVILDESHFKDLLTQHMAPPPASVNAESSLIRMGFPHHKLNQQDSDSTQRPSLCMCHMDNDSGPGLSNTGYYCPQCKSKYCELPVECKICGLTLVSAPHLARFYHHLFPLAPFHEVESCDLHETHCQACRKQLKDLSAFQCGRCFHVYCIDCNFFLHETLHSCPGCASSRKTQQVEAVIPGSMMKT